MSKARKKTTKRKKASTRQRRPDWIGTAAGTGGTDAAEVTPYPSVGDNPEFAELAANEAKRERTRVAEQGEPPGPGRPVGRPPGTGKHQKAAAALNEYQASGLDEQVIAAVWRGVFEAAALLLRSDALKINDAEATALARPSGVLWGYYMPSKLTPEQAAWSQLGLALFGIIGARAEAIRQGIEKRRAATRPTPTRTPAAGGPARPGAAKPTDGDLPQAEVTNFKPKGG